MKISVFAEHLFEAAEQEKIPLTQVLEKVKNMGISGVELDYIRLEQDDVLPDLFRNHGLDISCVYVFLDFSHSDDMSYAENVVCSLKKHNIKRLMGIAGFVYENDDINTCTQRMYEGMNKLSKLCCEAGISLCLEDFDDKNAVFSTINGLTGFMENVHNLGCAFDTGNFIYSNESALDAFDKLKNKIVHLHCKDRSYTQKAGEEPKIALNGQALYSSPVGYGEMPIEYIVKELLKSGYDGYFAIEHFGSQNQLSDIQKSAEKLKEWYHDTCNCME